MNREFVIAAFAGPDDPPDQKSLEAAIQELDKATMSWQTLSASISKYFSNQRSIERKLEPAFGITYDNRALIYEARGEKALAENDRKKWKELQGKPQ